MKKIILKLCFLGLLSPAFYFSQNTNLPAQEEKSGYEKPYNETENAEVEIEKLIKKAQEENKNIIVQAGGNWCIWCLRFHNFVKTTPELNQLVEDNFIYYHLNFSPKNKNEKTFAKYNPEGIKYGYPYFFVLDKNGNRLHTQESGIFEEGKGYNLDKVKEFFQSWIKKDLGNH